MKSALLSKIAMCVCPPVVVATTAVSVPPVKRAVHRLTAPRGIPAVASVRPRRTFTAAYDCTPTAVPITNLAPNSYGNVAPSDVTGTRQTLTDASPAPIGPVSSLSGTPAFDAAGFPGGPSIISPGVVIPVAVVNTPGETPPTTVVTPPGSSALPEPSTWAMTIGGFGAVGWALRRKPAAPAAEKIA